MTREELENLPLNANFRDRKARRSIFGGAARWSAMTGSIFERADLGKTMLSGTNLTDANLGEAKFHEASLVRTSLVDANLSGAFGLDTCTHQGPSYISFATLARKIHAGLRAALSERG
jgi:uncharacterized protein YjbI with pentapeptide repeats